MLVLVPLESISPEKGFAERMKYKLSSRNPDDTGITQKDLSLSNRSAGKSNQKLPPSYGKTFYGN